MRLVLLGGAPGVGKSATARKLLRRCEGHPVGPVQWVEVDAGTPVTTVQLRLPGPAWRQRFTADPGRPALRRFFLERYEQAQTTVADHLVDIYGLTPSAVAAAVAAAVGLP